MLEIGVGTGKNLPFYPNGVYVTGIDVSPRMLDRARSRMGSLPVSAELLEADAQDLPFGDDTFDTAVGTCVFCSVADPVRASKSLDVWCILMAGYCCSSMSVPRTASWAASPISLASSRERSSGFARIGEPRRTCGPRALR